MAGKLDDSLDPEKLKGRFKAYATESLIAELNSDSPTRQYYATNSIMLHRTPEARFYATAPPDTSPSRPLYKGLRKEEIIKQVFEIMEIAPTEDVREWLYSRIKSAKKQIFDDLFSGDEKRQVVGVAYLTGLFRDGSFWV